MREEPALGRRLLILSCSRCKRLDPGLLPAVERYDGPAFRVLRRYLREGLPETPDVRIISAEHGLILHDLPIAAYDRKMTSARARELRPLILAEIDRMTTSRSLPETLIFAGQQYLPTLNIDGASLTQNSTIRVCAGTMGKKLAELHDWLHGGPPELRYNPTMLAEGNRARIRGEVLSKVVDRPPITRRPSPRFSRPTLRSRTRLRP